MEAGIRDLRDHLSRYVRLVEEGTEVTVTDHGRAIARLVPFDRPRPIDRLIAEGLVIPATRSKRRREQPPVTGTDAVSTLVREQRR